MESTEQPSLTTQPSAAPPSSPAVSPPGSEYIPKWANETDEHKYARHTRNAAVFIAWVIGISAVVGIILGVLGVIDLGRAANAVNPVPSSTCFNANDPSTVGLPVC